MQAHTTLLELPLQDCLVYLCGTKYDLVQEDKKARKVEASTVERYGDGKCFNSLIVIQLFLYLAEISAKLIETSSKTGHNIGKK